VRLLAIVIAFAAVCVTGAPTLVGQRQTSAQESLSRFGLYISVPPPWHGRIYRRPGGLPILHTGNFVLPRGDDDAGAKAIKRMRKRSIFIVLMESGNPRAFHFRKVVRAPQVRRRDFVALFKGVPPTHAFARITFTTRHRYFDLWVQFGVRPAPAQLVRAANRVLSTLTVT
jgi:hypothetical protein